MANLADYEWLVGPEAEPYLGEVAASTEPLLKQLNRLRKSLSAERAGLVVQQTELRKRAIQKFGKLAATMFFTEVGFQQSTDLWVARYKASRINAAAEIVDYCTGIGGDLLALAERGPTHGWDKSPEIACLAQANLRAAGLAESCNVHVGEVEDHPPTAHQVWHLDPDRRTDGRRSTQLQWHSPAPEVVERWMDANPNGCIKLAPASSVPESWAERAELEWISRDRECRQQVVWFGNLAQHPGRCRATAVSSQAENPALGSFIGHPNAEASITSQIQACIYDTDPAIRAAGLTGAIAADHDLTALDSGAAYLTADSAAEHPLLTRFRVRDVLPLRIADVSKHLQALGIGQLEIKTRGVDVDPHQFRKQLKLRGDLPATVLLTSVGNRNVAVLADRED